MMDEDRKMLQHDLQMYDDCIAMRREKREAIPQAWVDGRARVAEKLRGDTPAEPDCIAGMLVFGHPQATNIEPEQYGHLVPIWAKRGDDISSRVKWAQQEVDKLQTKIGEAQALAAGRAAAMAGRKKKARLYLLSAQHVTDETVLELLRGETLPELNRLIKALEGQPCAEPDGVSVQRHRAGVEDDGKMPRGWRRDGSG